MKRFLLISISLLSLNACSTMKNDQTQEVTLRTPGAANARCIVENQDMKYVGYTDQTIEIMRSPHDLVVRCQAAGNREQTIHVKREVDDWVVVNVVNGFVPGAAYDYFSRGAFTYPDVLTVSFTGDPIKPYSLPQYHDRDLKHTNEYGTTEYMGPSEVLTDEMRDAAPNELKKKENLYSRPDFGPDKIQQQYNSKSVYNPTEEDK